MLQRRKQEALARASGTSRRASGWVRKPRAVEDPSVPIPEEMTSELRGTTFLLITPIASGPVPLA